ncbi:hypothetical protein PMAYCL1PPCAC_24379, partial [Pristionchus mayeri]
MSDFLVSGADSELLTDLCGCGSTLSQFLLDVFHLPHETCLAHLNHRIRVVRLQNFRAQLVEDLLLDILVIEEEIHKHRTRLAQLNKVDIINGVKRSCSSCRKKDEGEK